MDTGFRRKTKNGNTGHQGGQNTAQYKNDVDI